MSDSTTGRDLWRRAIEAPDDAATLAVLGDHLQTEGDPRGQLVALQLAARSGARVEAEDRYRFEHRHALLGPLAASETPCRAVWEGGFIRELEVVVRGYGEELAEAIRDLRRRGGLRLLRRLRLVGTANYDRPMTELLRHEWPLLEVLHLGPMSLGAGRIDLPLDDVLGGFPRLRDLRIEFPGSFTGLVHPRLERLVMSGHAHQFPSLRLGGLPSLQAIRLFSREDPDGPVLDDALEHPPTEVALHGGLIDAWLASKRVRPPAVLRLFRARVAHREAIEARLPLWPDTRVVYAGEENANRDRLLTPSEQAQPRRFVRDGRFWQAHREADVLVFRYGKVGKPGTRRTNRYFDAYHASRELRDRIQAKRDDGYEEVWLPPTERG
ncbi:MAG: WGR domain-containing protein [Alphaproteobacteria bacterium]|nr:WGR domain-containing protein [Alphaproteobacteria bacterium]